eukprot:scaffold23509_cov19-Tisochrysis_lutea.AAC.1
MRSQHLCHACLVKSTDHTTSSRNQQPATWLARSQHLHNGGLAACLHLHHQQHSMTNQPTNQPPGLRTASICARAALQPACICPADSTR